jgi:hypothetical protein
MRPAGGLGDPVAGEQLVEPGIAVGVDDAAEGLQMRLRMLALAVGRIEEQRRRRARAGERPLVAHVDPEPSGLGLAGARRQHRHRRVVDMQGVRGHRLSGERINQRRQSRGRRTDPAGQGRGLQADALAGEDLGLAVERQVVVVLRDDDVRQQPGAGAATGDRVVGRRGRDHRLAGPAGELLAHVPDHLEAARHIVEGLGRLLADPAQSGAAIGAGAGGGMQHLFARQMLGQQPARRLLFLDRFLDDRRHLGRGSRQALGLVALQALDRQLELLDLARQLLRGPPELGAPVARQLELQLGDLGPRRHRIARHLGDDPLQRGDVVGQGFGRDRHAGDWIRSAVAWLA